MNRLVRLLTIGMAMGFAAAAAASPRARFTINDNWRYAPGAIENAEAAQFDDSRWQRIDLPHTWNAADAFDKSAKYRRGIGWYRRSLTLDPSLKDKRIYLYFEGANQVADVFVNGRSAGRHVGGYTAFVFDVTALVTFDRPNTIAVRVDNSADPDVPPLDADFTFFGGIYRNVWLVATTPVHIDVDDYASPGVFVSTPDLTPARGAVRITGRVANQSTRAAAVRVVNSVFDRDGEMVASATSSLQLAAGATAAFDQTTPEVDHPNLWSPSSPYLYRVRTEVFTGDELADAVANPLGFRWFDVDAKKGFTLNGRPLRLYGTNRHQDYPGLGNALPDEMHRRDIHLVKETGFTFLRLAHYPQDPAVLDEADREGLVLWEEIPIVNRIAVDASAGHTDRARFAANATRMLTEMIRQHYNHPSIFFWGFMNEVTLRKPQPLPDGYYDGVLGLARQLNGLAHNEDATRRTTMALSLHELTDDHGLASVTDVLGMNLYLGWYEGQTSDLGPFLDRIHRDRPDRPLIISEYGAGSDERVHSTKPQRFDFSAEYAQEFHRASFPQIESRPYLVASAAWNQFDFAAAGRQDTKFGINNKGLFLYDRTPKDVAFYYEAALRTAPFLRIAREWRDRASDRTQPLRVYTNQSQVELFVNGQSAGVKSASNRTADWQVPLEAGENRIVARSGAVEDAITIRFDDRSSGGFRAVNTGSWYSYTDAAQIVWEADRPYEPGRWGFVGGTEQLTHHSIFGTPDDPLFQASREGVERYRFDVADGAYDVTLRFAAGDEKPGARVFSVSINGREVVHDFDLAAQYGSYVAVERTFSTEAMDGGITIEFKASARKSTVSGIALQRTR